MCQIIGALLQNISMPGIDLLVVLSPAWFLSTKQCVDMDNPRGSGISKGIGSLSSLYKSSQSKIWNLSSDMIGFFGSNTTFAWVPVLSIRISDTLLVGDRCEGAPDVMRAGILRGGCLFSRSLLPTLVF